MKLPKTIKGYISLMRQLYKKSIRTLKGFDLLSEKDRDTLISLDAEISNYINEIDED